MILPSLSRRAFSEATRANSWEEIWEAGPYFDRISVLLENAQNYVVFAGWQIDSRLPLSSARSAYLEPLREKIIRLCDKKPGFKVYFLLWDHAYFYILERETWQGRIWGDIHPQVHFVFDNRHCIGGAHHEKIAVIDGKTALCGGIDLCDGRWDTPLHSYYDNCRSLNRIHESHGPFHDLAVQVTGPICEGLQNHIARRWKALSSIPFPSVTPQEKLENRDEARGPSHTVYLSRTIAELDSDPGKVMLVREVEFLFRDLIFSAQKQIILEGQYYWSKILNNLLIKKIQQMKGKEFNIYLILSDLRYVKSLTKLMRPYEFGLLEHLSRVARDAGVQLIIGFPTVLPPSESPGLPTSGKAVLPPKPIYVHSKVIVIDDRFLGIGSANLASRALRIDTEIHLTLEAKREDERAHIASVAKFMLRHWRLIPAENGALDANGALSEAASSSIYLQRFQASSSVNGVLDDSFTRPQIPWQVLFDPVLPWFYRLKRKYRGLARRRWYPVIYTLVLIWIFGTFLSWMLLGIPWGQSRWPVYYLALLSSVWLLPIPFIFIQFLIVFHLGYLTAVKIIVTALWVASVFGYLVARSFPTSSFYYYSLSSPSWLPQRLGLRSLPVLISVLLDPRISIHSKIAYQGFYCIPLPWFVLGTGVVLPTLLYISARLEGYLLPQMIPPVMANFIQEEMSYILVAICVLSFVRLGGKWWGKLSGLLKK